MDKIEKIVVVMFENRSLDSVLGWLYTKDHLPNKIIDRSHVGPDHYDGLAYGDYSNPNVEGANPAIVKVKFGTKDSYSPTPDPNERFNNMTRQIYWGVEPVEGDIAPMNGFVRDYATTFFSNPEEIMHTYRPDQLPVLNFLARNFASSDRYFASTPTQTFPNRAFLHSATSQGHVNNADSLLYSSKTIFNVFHDSGVPWKVYSSDSIFPSLVRTVMTKLWSSSLSYGFSDWSGFMSDAKEGKLPAYSFVEPGMLLGSTIGSYHPPTDVLQGEAFLMNLYNTIYSGPDADKTMLIINFDEHGGIYDHVSPPWGATPPDAQSFPGDRGFKFNRFGVRVPLILISPWIDSGIIFRSPGTPYDHTSILATLMDWKGIARKELPSKRLAVAENLMSIPTLTSPREMKQMTKSMLSSNSKGNNAVQGSSAENSDRDLNDLEKGILSAYTIYMNDTKGKKMTPEDACNRVKDKKLKDVDQYVKSLRNDFKS